MTSSASQDTCSPRCRWRISWRHGSLRMDAVVPDEMNRGGHRRPQGRHPRRARTAPRCRRRSRTARSSSGWCSCRRSPAPSRAWSGPEPTVDHHFVHIRKAHEGEAQNLHADAIIDVRPDAFDVQLMYYPQEVTLEMGGTLSVPGSHLRRINETDTGRYQNLRGQTRLTCPAGTVVFLHHGIWHGGRRNDSDIDRYMFKIRFNPTVRQVRLWNTDDLYDEAVAAELEHDLPLVRDRHGPAGDLQPGQAVAGPHRRRHVRPGLLGHPGDEPPAPGCRAAQPSTRTPRRRRWHDRHAERSPADGPPAGAGALPGLVGA